MITKKNFLISLFAVIIISIISSGAYFYLKGRQLKSPVADANPSVAPVIFQDEELIKWEDQAEFLILYPKSLKLDPHKEDNENYAHIELTSDKFSGNATFWVKDTDASDINAWIKANKLEGSIDSMLDGVEAKKVLTNSSPKKIITAAINKGYLYEIETVLDENGNWNKINNIIVSNFKFTSSGDKKNINTVSDNGSEDNSSPDFSEEELVE